MIYRQNKSVNTDLAYVAALCKCAWFIGKYRDTCPLFYSMLLGMSSMTNVFSYNASVVKKPAKSDVVRMRPAILVGLPLISLFLTSPSIETSVWVVVSEVVAGAAVMVRTPLV